ncbi:MAG: mechanosensitive ion channel [Anaeromyxobacter sp.]
MLGTGERGLGGLGWTVLIALGLGLTPIAATVLLGVLAVYGGALHPGAEVEVGGRRGRVLEVTLREVVLQDEQGGVVRVPHLLTLLHPTRVGRRP